MKFEKEQGGGMNENCFHYGDGVVMKIDCEIPFCNLVQIINAESIGYDKDGSENIEDTDSEADGISHENDVKTHNMQLFYENCLNYTHNPRHVVKECTSSDDPYDNDMAEVKYLFSKPVAFIIIGKPSPDNKKLGKKLAEYWDCLYIDPITCFSIETDDNDSPALVWCRKHLSEGKCIPSEMVMRVMEQCALSDEAMHRGFVMCDLPFAQQNGEPSAQEQMHMIFSWPFDPKIFIYITCPNADVITKNQQMYYDTETQNYINKNVFSKNKEVVLVFSHEPRISTIDNVTDDIYKETEEEKALIPERNLKYLVVIPEPNIQYILPRYQQAALPPVELYIAQVHPQYVIRVDGRTSPSHMLKLVKARVEALPLQSVCKPLPMFRPKKEQIKEQKGEEEFEGEFEEEEEAMEEEENEFPFEFENLDEAYQELSHKEAVGVKFKWQKSNWKYLCPVSLKEGKVIEGDPKYSARFLNKIYFLSSPETLKAFLKNPRSYLLPPNPKPSCKFIVIGHENSSKSTVATYLAQNYQVKVIDFPSFIKDLQNKKTEEKTQSVRENAINSKLNEINKQRQQEYDASEMKRKKDIETWKKEQLNAIKQLNIPEYDENVEELEDMFPENEETTSPPIDFNSPLIPQLSLARCRWLSIHPDDLLKYLPDNLKFPTPLPQFVSEDDPAVQEYVQTMLKAIPNEGDKEQEKGGKAKKAEEEGEEKGMEEEAGFPSYIGELLVEGIKEVQKEIESQTDGEKLTEGWVIDDMTLDQEVWLHLAREEIVPEFVISLQDHSPEYSYLKERKMNQLKENAAIYQQEIGEEQEDEEEEEERKKVEVEGLEEGEEEEQQQQFQKLHLDEEDEGRFALEPGIGLDSEVLAKYGEMLAEFDEKWTSLQQFITPIHPPINIDVANKQLNDLLVEVSQAIQAFYNVTAEPFTEEDRAEERVTDHFDEMEPEEDEEEQMDEENENILKKRRMGDTGFYCPVAYQHNRVLWKGNNEFLAKYKGKVYSFTSEEAMEKFMAKPWNFVRHHKPETFFPHLRICIIGPAGSGKTMQGKLLARAFGLIHKDFLDEINLTILTKCKPVGRKVQYLAGRYIKDELREKELAGENEEQYEGDESEYEMNATDTGNRRLRDSIEQYLRDGTPMPDSILQKLLIPLWNSENFQCTGFVLSGFPSHPEDINIMKTNNLKPDLIISLSIPDAEYAKERLLKEMKEYHDKQIAKQKRKAEKERARLEAAIAAAGGVYVSSSFRMEIEKMIFDHLHEALPKEEGIPEEIEKEGIEEEEVDENENIRMQYEEDIQEWFNNDIEKLETLRTLAEENNIEWLDIHAVNEMQDVCLQTVHEIYPLKLRSSIIFEQTFPITLEESEQLLKSGYYFLSKFGRWCPVQLAAGKIPVYLFPPMIQKAEIFPVIHRQFIYFIGGQGSLDLFQKDPMKYISNAQPVPSIPIKIAIIGPPKCGKSILAKRLSDELDIKVITIGQAIRYVLEDLSWTELATSVEDVLKQGEVVPVKLALRCVEAATMDPRSATQGYVFDGFPVSADQIQEMSSLNLFPYLIFNLECTLQKCTCQTRLQSDEASCFSRTPFFSTKLLQYKYKCWSPASGEVKGKLREEYHNEVVLDGDHIIWWLTDKITEQLYYVMKSIYDYYSNITEGKPAKLECMCITPDEFRERQSKYMQFCPRCLEEGYLTNGGSPPDKMGLVQYKVHYYWLCDKHLPQFLENPIDFLPPANKADLADDLPFVPMNDEDFEIANDGYCIVTYTESIPERILMKGIPEYAIVYKKKKYLFGNAEQRDKFMRDPIFYSKKKMCLLALRIPQMNVLRFPTLGFLEQSVSNDIYSALLEVGSQRPKYPGLPLDLSAAIFLGYNLKLMNPKISPAQKEMLTAAQEEFLRRCKILKKLCQKAKICNPFLAGSQNIKNLYDGEEEEEEESEHEEVFV